MSNDDLFVLAVRVETWTGEARLTNASGCFYLDAGMLYLITNRHVVIDEANGHLPDSIRMLLYTDFFKEKPS